MFKVKSEIANAQDLKRLEEINLILDSNLESICCSEYSFPLFLFFYK